MSKKRILTAKVIDDIENNRGDYPLSVYEAVAEASGVPMWILFHPDIPRGITEAGIAALEVNVRRCILETAAGAAPDLRRLDA